MICESVVKWCMFALYVFQAVTDDCKLRQEHAEFVRTKDFTEPPLFTQPASREAFLCQREGSGPDVLGCGAHYAL